MKIRQTESSNSQVRPKEEKGRTDVYFSVDVETDGKIPGPNSMLSFALTFAGTFDGKIFQAPEKYDTYFYRELRPISESYDTEALSVNGLDRERLIKQGATPEAAMSEAASWVMEVSGPHTPVCVAYPLSFDWIWLYWYFVNFSEIGSPFGFSRCYDLKTAIATKFHKTISGSGREKIPEHLRPKTEHTHHALDDSIEQAIIFRNVFNSEGELS